MIKHFICLCTIFTILISCQGDQGDPGPAGTDGQQGAQGVQGPAGPQGPDATQSIINGSFTGTVTGLRKDGTTPINETFEYTYSYGAEGFTGSLLNLTRFRKPYIDEDSQLQLGLEFENFGLSNQKIKLNQKYYSTFSLLKELSGNKLFSINATVTPFAFNITYPIDPANSLYPFAFTFGIYSPQDVYLNYESILENGIYYFVFRTKSNESVYFKQSWNGGNFYKIVKSDGTSSTTSATYGSLILSQNSDNRLIFNNANGNDLSKTISYPADDITITNYNYNTTTSILTFDYVLNIGGYPRQNNTTNPLKIVGKFSGKIYQEIINGRVASGD